MDPGEPKRADPLVQNGLALVANTAVAAGLGFLFWVAGARLFAPEALGWGAAVVSAATLAALLGRAGFDAAVVRYGAGAPHATYRRLVGGALLGSVLLAAGFALLFLGLSGTLFPDLAPLRIPVAALAFVSLAAGIAAGWILDAAFLAEQSARFVLWRTATFNVVKLATPLFVVGALDAFAVPFAWGVGVALSLVVAALLFARTLRTRRPTHEDPSPPAREVASYSARNFVLNVSEFLPGLILPILVLDVSGPAATASFFLAWTVAAVGFLASKAIAQSAFVALVRGRGVVAAMRKALGLSAALVLPGVALLLLAPGLLLAAFGPGYDDPTTRTTLRLLAAAVLPGVLLNLYLAYLKAREPGLELTLLPLLAVGAFLAAVPAALALAGVTGVALAWLLVQSVAGAVAASRLLVKTRRSPLAPPRTLLDRRPHQG